MPMIRLKKMLGVISGTVKDINQGPVADGWIFGIEQPEKRIAVQTFLPILHCEASAVQSHRSVYKKNAAKPIVLLNRRAKTGSQPHRRGKGEHPATSDLLLSWPPGQVVDHPIAGK